MLSFGAILVPINLLFLFLGSTLWIFATEAGIALGPGQTSDELFPTIALQHLGIAAGLAFFFGLVSAAYSSADGTLTALTTVFCIDFLGLRRKPGMTEKRIEKIRYRVHVMFAFIMLLIIIGYDTINNEALISQLFTIAGYTYGPLLGMYFVGLYTRWQLRDRFVPVVAILSPALSYLISRNSEFLFNGYQFGFEILIVNGLITIFGLYLLKRKPGKDALPGPDA